MNQEGTIALKTTRSKRTTPPRNPIAIKVIANAFREAEAVGRPGVSFVSLPQDVMLAPAPKLAVLGRSLHQGGGHPDDLAAAAAAINGARAPVMLLGMFASAPAPAAELRRLLAWRAIPTVTTFQVRAGDLGRRQQCSPVTSVANLRAAALREVKGAGAVKSNAGTKMRPPRPQRQTHTNTTNDAHQTPMQ